MIRPLPKSVLLAAVVFLCQTPSVAQGGTLSKAEVDALWEQLLLEERYEAIQYFYRSSQPSVFRSPDRELLVQATRECLLWCLFGELRTGCGWKVSRRLEAEEPSASGRLQLYSNATSKLFPVVGFV